MNNQTACWGIDTKTMKIGSNSYKLIDVIMKNRCFSGFNGIIASLSKIKSGNGNNNNKNSRDGKVDDPSVVYSCCKEDCYEYLSLIFKYFDKNTNVIIREFASNNVKDNAFTVVLELFPGDEKWIQLLLFDKFEQLYGKLRIKVSEKVLNNLHSVCKTKHKNKKIMDLIVKYAKSTQSTITNP